MRLLALVLLASFASPGVRAQDAPAQNTPAAPSISLSDIARAADTVDTLGDVLFVLNVVEAVGDDGQAQAISDAQRHRDLSGLREMIGVLRTVAFIQTVEEVTGQ